MGHAKLARWAWSFSVVVVAAALWPAARAGAQGICEDVGVSAVLGNCTKPGPEWQLAGQYACALSVTTSADGSCWLQLSSGDPESPCALRHSEPTIADAAAYQFEARFLLVNSGPECDQCGTAATLAVSDGERMFDLMVQSGDPGTLRVGLGAKGGEPSVTFDSTTPHVLHADVSRDGVASVLLDGAPVASVAYSDLPLVPPGNVLPTWEVVNDILGNLDIDYARFDVCASEPPPSNQVQVTKTKTMPRPYIPGQKVLTITTDALVADVRPSGPDPKAVFSLQVTQTLVATASQQSLAKSVVTTPLDFSTIPLGAQLPVSSSWQWDGQTLAGDLAPRGWMTIKTRADLTQTLNGATTRVATNYGTKDVWIGPTLRQWGLRPPTRMATPVFDKTYSLPAGKDAGLPNKVTYTFTASCSVPPVVRVYEVKQGGAWAQSAVDLNPSGQARAFTSVTVNKSPRGESRRVLVHTKAKDATGSCTITVTCDACNGKPFAVTSGDISLPYEPLTNPVISGEALQTALAPDGATDTVLYAVKNRDDRLETALDTILAIDDDSGVGKASRIVLPKDATGFLVANKAGTPSGETRVYLDDLLPGYDLDGDGLGSELEWEIGTCDSGATSPNLEMPVYPASGGGCAAVAQRHPTWDTDGDGISDYWEVYGCDSDSTHTWLPPQAFCPSAGPGIFESQFLPLWGASPRKMDVFVEADVTCGGTGQPPCAPNPWLNTNWDSAKMLNDWAAIFAEAPVGDVLNPDGTDGIALHVDIGTNQLSQKPTNPVPTTLAGNWFGGEVVQSPNTATFSPRRVGIFHHASFGIEAGSGGFGREFTASLGWAPPNSHELGHVLGLGHGGADFLNCKPHYRSVMNYAYDYSYAHFSRGDWSSVVLNPAVLDEWSGAGSADPALAFLSQPPFSFPFIDDTGAPVALGNWQGHIDWNGNGRLDKETRALLARTGDCDTYYRVDWLSSPTTGAFERAAIERLYMDPLYVFFNVNGQLNAVRTTQHNFADCTVPSPFAGCGRWEAVKDPGFAGGSGPATSLVGGPAAVYVPGFGILLALRQADGSILTKVLDEFGRLGTAWQAVVPTAGATGDPGLALLDGRVFMLYPGPGGFLMQVTRPIDLTAGWDTPRLVWVSQGGAWVPLQTGSFDGVPAGVTLAQGYVPAAGGVAAHDSLFGLFVRSDSSMALYAHASTDAAEAWTEQTAAFARFPLPPPPAPQVRAGVAGTPGMAFQRFNWTDPDGRLMIWYDDARQYYGARFITYNFQDAQGSFVAYVLSGPTGGPVPNGFSGFSTNAWDSVYDNSFQDVTTSGRAAAPLTLFWDDRTSSASGVRGLRIYGPPNHVPQLAIFPYADGTMPVKMRDFNDFQLMRIGIPRSLTPTSKWCDSTTPQPLPSFDGCCVCNAPDWEPRLPNQCRACTTAAGCEPDERCQNGICVGAAVYDGMY